jgi:hypothetical protein
MQGEGVLVYGTGDKYEGEFYQGVANGIVIEERNILLRRQGNLFF